ncbi:MAG: hypothetical protein LBH03_00485 [Holophagales bacterium]|nr:hypothetical protein [Holophagales bacterium]
MDRAQFKNIPPGTMINWTFPPLTSNRVPPQTASGAQTWWQYSENGEATWIGKSAGSANYLQLSWDRLGLLKTVVEHCYALQVKRL